MVTLIIFDLFPAFDVIDHPIPLKDLECFLCQQGEWLTQVNLYLANRTQYVSITGKTSLVAHLNFGVPQGTLIRVKE